MATLSEAQASKTTLAELEKLIDGLAPVDDLSISALVKSIAEPSAAPKSVRPKQLNEDVVAHYSVRLSDARHDRDRFDAVFMELQSDKRVKVAEADAIARQFVGGTSAYKKRADALKDIRLRFDASVAGDRRREASSEIF